MVYIVYKIPPNFLFFIFFLFEGYFNEIFFFKKKKFNNWLN